MNNEIKNNIYKQFNLNLISFILIFISQILYFENIIKENSFENFSFHGLEIKYCSNLFIIEYFKELKNDLLEILNTKTYKFIKIETYSDNKINSIFIIDFYQFYNIMDIKLNFIPNYLNFDFLIKNLLSNFLNKNKFTKDKSNNFKIKFGISKSNLTQNNLLGEVNTYKNNLRLKNNFKIFDFPLIIEQYE